MTNDNDTPTQPAPPPEPKAQDQIIPAFIEALGKIEAVIKSKTANVHSRRTGQTHSYRYANINNILHDINPVLAEHSLRASFNLLTTTLGIYPRLTLFHKSGQSMEWHDFYMPYSGNGPQDIASIITVGQRLSLAGAFSIPLLEDLDDDGKRGQDAHDNQRNTNTGSKNLAGSLNKNKPVTVDYETLDNKAVGIKGELDELGLTPEQLREAMKKVKGFDHTIIDGSPADWPVEWAGKIAKWIDSHRARIAKEAEAHTPDNGSEGS